MATPTNQFRLKLAPSTAYNFFIDWGDGSSQNFNQTTNALEISAGLTHTYPTSGSYILTITENVLGGFPRIFFNGGTDQSSTNDDVKVTDIVQWGNPSWSSMTDAFEGCSNLNAIATDNGNSTLSGVTNFTNAWNNCTSLSSFPLIDTSKGTSFNNTWSNCTSLSSFPLIDTSKATNFDGTWANCYSLKTFPVLNMLSATNINNTWLGCISLTAFPAALSSFSNHSGALWQTWVNCYALKSFPVISIPKVTAFKQTWVNCTNLVNFPLINTSNITDMGAPWEYGGGAWAGCSSLTAFPHLNTSNCTSFWATWQNCINLSASDFPTLNMSKMTNGINCFAGVKLTTNSYSLLLSSICATNLNSGVTFHGGNSLYNPTFGLSARNYLVNTKGWTITDGGEDNTYLILNDQSGSITQEDNSPILINI